MKKIIKYLLVAFYCFLSKGADAQILMSDPSMTYVNVPTYSNKETAFSYRWNNGAHFQGRKKEFYANSQVINVSFYGTMTYHDGTKMISNQTMGSFDKNFNPNGHFIYEKNGEFYSVYFHNGNVTKSSNINKNQFYIDNYCAVFYTNANNGNGVYIDPQITNGNIYNNSGNYNNSTNSSSSSYESKYATCSGCHGTGKCQNCGGKGWKQGSGLNSTPYKCSLCHGTGVCQSCHGKGKVYVGF